MTKDWVLFIVLVSTPIVVFLAGLARRLRRPSSLFIRDCYGYTIKAKSDGPGVTAQMFIYMPWWFGLYKERDVVWSSATQSSTTPEKFISACHKKVEEYMAQQVERWNFYSTLKTLSDSQEAFSQLVQKMKI